MSDDAAIVHNLLASVAVLKSQMNDAGRGLEKLETILTNLIDEVRNLATKEIEHTYERRQLEALIRDLEDLKVRMDEMSKAFVSFKEESRDDREAALEKERDEAKEQAQKLVDAEDKDREIWKDSMRKTAGRIIETIIISTISILVYHYSGLRLPG